MTDFIAASSSNHVRVVSPHATSLRNLLVDDGVSITSVEPGMLDIEGVPAARVGEVAAEHGLTLHELTTVEASLEQAFMELTRDSVEFHGATATTTSETDRKAA
jgi:ABC-2 type transport system ATP-binding protein